MTKPPINAFFPTANALGITPESHHPLPERPTEVAPILDPENAYRPILEFDDTVRQSCFGENPTATAEAFAPPQPETFNDLYLYPFLARNERLRLTLLWYYTRLITKNDALMSKLHGLLTIVQKFMGWEFAIVGMLDEAVYTRLAAINLPLAMLPRRESTCAHTINQDPGTVFSITNMAEDWRFKSSPHVAIGGLRSYAGTQLRIRIGTGEEVALGSLCIASNTVQKPLTPEQKASLVGFAEMITSELVTTLRQNRIREKERKVEQLMKVKEEQDVSESELKDRLHGLIKSFYPAASISIQTSDEHVICLQGDVNINFNAVKSGLWEDTMFINEIIRTGNHSRLLSSQTVRAIVSKCGSLNLFVVVASCDIQHVFDDYDAWFIEACAQVMTDFIHQQHLQEALRAKEAFLRGITHQLRTPIHGVLASSELLAEVLASPDLFITGQESCIQDSALTHVGTIQASGSQLMATVNDLLKFNTWSRNKAEDLKPISYDLHCVEKDIMDRLRESMTEPLNPGVTTSFEVHLATERSLVTIDANILQDALQPLIVNALQATTCGGITLRISTQAESSTLQFDIVDTGSGIPSCDQIRIFQAFEKGSIHAPGVGLGLTLAVKAAHLLGGTVHLISSEPGIGSHFRVELPDLVFTTSETLSGTQLDTTRSPRAFHMLNEATETSALLLDLASHLQERGFTESKDPEGCLIIMTLPTPLDALPQVLLSLQNPHPVIFVTTQNSSLTTQPDSLRALIPSHHPLIALSPFSSTDLDQIIMQAEQLIIVPIANTSQEVATSGLQSTTTGMESEATPSLSSLSINPHIPQQSPLAPRALLVDDNAINLKVLRMYCEKRAIPYLLATNGQEAIDQFKMASETGTSPVNLVLMDLQMPICGGLEACTSIRAFEAANSLPPCTLFMVTGQDSRNDRLLSLEAGSNEFLVKPVSLKLLDKHLARYKIR